MIFNKVILNNFSSNNFNKGASKLKQFIWLVLNAIFIQSSWFPFMKPKVMLLKIFGAKIGNGVVIKPAVTIKFPWKLIVGDYVWIGENVWIDNLDKVDIGNNVCISQGAMLLTGNHDYKIPSFDYRNAPIHIEDGVWIGAKSIVCPGVICKSHAILTVGSIATKDLEAFIIYQGNPALKIRERVIK
jgi:putative colanic acid biosynthesis acetyltransferase WcaF